jgi:hypothetical protein
MADAVDAGSSKIGQGASGTAASDSAPSAARRLTAYLSQHATAVVTTTLVGILTAFSGSIVEGVKFRLNRADLRIERYQTLATDISQHAFSVELVHEFFKENWTTLPTLKWLISEYNTSITTLRKKEFVYLQWLHHYWDEMHEAEFTELMNVAREIDRAIHGLNDELEKVENDNKNHPKVDKQRASKTAAELEPLVRSLREKAAVFLKNLT